MGWESPYPNPCCPPRLSGPDVHMAASLAVRITGELGSPGNPVRRREGLGGPTLPVWSEACV